MRKRRLIEYFVAGTTARCASEIVGVNQNTAVYYYQRLREIISQQLDLESEEVFKGEIEIDESYFGGTRKGKRGRGAAGKVAVFGLLKRSGRVYAKIIPDASSNTLIPIIESKVVPDSVNSDCRKEDEVLAVWELNTIELTILSCLPTSTIISMAQRISGIKLSDTFVNLMAYPEIAV